VERFGQGAWEARRIASDGSAFDVFFEGARQGRLAWSQLGAHNICNALAAIAAARHAGVAPEVAIAALARFEGVKRRMERRGVVNGVVVYDDFAHHPTAIATTLEGLRNRVGKEQRIIAVLEPRSNTMRLGVFKAELAPAFQAADRVILYQAPELDWDLNAVVAASGKPGQVCGSIEATVAAIAAAARPGDHILIMSNGGFGGLHERVLERLRGAQNCPDQGARQGASPAP
jgi:UDP-N-acetylmuramate: L-alanyl-gamma-D-glutamyl-meso-diaminopimelate ligase